VVQPGASSLKGIIRNNAAVYPTELNSWSLGYLSRQCAVSSDANHT
jgi:hypothetical protein